MLKDKERKSEKQRPNKRKLIQRKVKKKKDRSPKINPKSQRIWSSNKKGDIIDSASVNSATKRSGLRSAVKDKQVLAGPTKMQKNENAEPTILLKGATLYDDWDKTAKLFNKKPHSNKELFSNVIKSTTIKAPMNIIQENQKQHYLLKFLDIKKKKDVELFRKFLQGMNTLWAYVGKK